MMVYAMFYGFFLKLLISIALKILYFFAKRSDNDLDDTVVEFVADSLKVKIR